MELDYQSFLHQPEKLPIADAYRVLRTNLHFTDQEDAAKAIMVTSALPGEGKSIIAANVAISFAQLGKKVVLVDCNLHHPVQHKLINKRRRATTEHRDGGIGDVLLRGKDIENLIYDTEVRNLSLVTSGYLPLNPSQYLVKEGMDQVIDFLKGQADLVIIDTPAVSFAADACVLAAKTDGIILVVETGKVRPEIAQKAKRTLLKANGRIMGVVLNRIQSGSY